MYEDIGPFHAEDILGFHVFTGRKQNGSFYGKSYAECLRDFSYFDPLILHEIFYDH